MIANTPPVYERSSDRSQLPLGGQLSGGNATGAADTLVPLSSVAACEPREESTTTSLRSVYLLEKQKDTTDVVVIVRPLVIYR